MNSRLKKYIKVEEEPNPGHKTKIWCIWNVQTGEVLGRVKWYGGWRKYVYWNQGEGYSDWEFMRMVADFCETETSKQLNKL